MTELSAPKAISDHIDYVNEVDPSIIQASFDTLRGLNREDLDALEKGLLRKIDWRMMPTITVMFLMSYLDRINVSNARLAGLQEDLEMSDTVWNTGISMFYVGYLIGQLPGNLWLAKSNPRTGLSFMMLAWSICTICMPAMKSGVGFCVCRFFVGLTEAPFFPGIALLTSSWYNKKESPTRMAIWHAGNTISNVISGFLAAGILYNMDGLLQLHAWQWFFLIEGAASILVAIAAFFLLPNWPHNTKWITEQEREMAQYRIMVSNGGHEETQGGTWDGVKAAVKEPFTWLFCGLHFSLVNAQSFKDFFPSILATFGFSELTTYLVQAPPYIIAYLSALAIAYSSGKYQESCYHIIVPIVLGAGGAAMLISTLNEGARYFGMIILISGTYSGLNLQLSWETTLVPSSTEQKSGVDCHC
ncbi:hypothetical protein N7497_011966 [Penicillium chrysogenum]|nr:hypothetical protein N7497_011966 [Penicillium chrysogenum]